ncbi:hypothetical protein K470DRAFT_289483 [Piedraia hortae CBS 480.64]|uniref:Uncharacterized protein n=1 Tax=Piedraia hortae CBS 480.64 TaxID=1314780 RepID=A0A6A7BTN4_9PEZI|nr:hypothetical protein K470DRAFT_289483 [Piedraia hortae CBS 480.64]
MWPNMNIMNEGPSRGSLHPSFGSLRPVGSPAPGSVLSVRTVPTPTRTPTAASALTVAAAEPTAPYIKGRHTVGTGQIVYEVYQPGKGTSTVSLEDVEKYIPYEVLERFEHARIREEEFNFPQPKRRASKGSAKKSRGRKPVPITDDEYEDGGVSGDGDNATGKGADNEKDEDVEKAYFYNEEPEENLSDINPGEQAKVTD